MTATPPTPEEIETLFHFDIASIATAIRNLILWIYVLFRMLISKARAMFIVLIVICVFMIIALVSGTL